MNQTATASSNGTATTEAATPMAARLDDLREMAADDAVGAQIATWAWIQELGKRKAVDQLGELYRLGTPPRGLDGPTEGILVAPLIQGAVDRLITTVTGGWMPWLGKSFDSRANRGYNRLAASARWPAKLLWPRYGTTDDGDARGAFEFETAIEPGKADPDVEVLKVDYGPVESNPRLGIRQIRDEVVELVPDTYLGKILWRSGEGADESFICIGYFALRQPAN